MNINEFVKRLERAANEDIKLIIDGGVYKEGEARIIAQHNDKFYTMEVNDNKIVKCSCQDFHYRCEDGGKLAVCKHMIRASIELDLDL